jgi:hypothetical protein
MKIILACGLLAAGLSMATAAPTMRLSADGGLTWVVVVDNGPLDSNPAVGFISYGGPVGDWFANAETGFGEPLIGSATAPIMDVSSQNVSTQAETLIVQLSDTNFVAFPNQTFVASINGTTAGTVTYTSFRDAGNVLFGTTSTYAGDPVGVSPSPTASTLITEGPFTGGSFDSSNSVTVANGTTPYSLTLQTTVIHTTAGQTDTDSLLYSLAPPACNCTVTFNSPASITNCMGDAIPNVTASENCGSGPVSVPVIFVSATTNGVCPQIITRNYTATDDCSTVHPFTQTITINCLPDCTITTSVTSTTVGTTNLHAWVADSGAGATYAWNVINGTITAGQGTTNVTFTAGSDASNPVSITVKIINANGCQNNCTASIRNGPKPPACTITGVTISDTSWNKFNIPNGTSPVVWVHAHIGGLTGVPKTGVTTVQFTGVSITLGGTSYSLPDGVMIFDSSAPATPSTAFSGGKWTTTFNPNNLSDEMFFTGAAIPVTPAIAAGTKATLTYTTLASVEGLSFSWQWSAAVYTFWPTDWNQAMIQPYHKSDHAGTPENTTVQKSLIQGPRGGGGSNFTGSWSATGNAACQ